MAASIPAPANPARIWSWFTPAEFAGRRARLYVDIGDAVAVLQGAGPLRAFELFRQSNELLYLTGLEAPQAYLLLDGATQRATVYLPSRPEGRQGEETCVYAEDADRICALTGIDAVYPWSALEQHLAGRKVAYTPFAPAEGRMSSRDVLVHAARLEAGDPWDGGVTRQDRFIARLREVMADGEVRDLSPMLDAMRILKSTREVAVMRRAGELSARAVIEAMAMTRPGLRESDLHAAMHRVFIAGGARGEGYRAIIPAGQENAWDGHYCRNDGPLIDGDLILMDCAPEVCYYTSDIGRMWPVSARYSSEQRDLYGFIVRFHRALMERVRPGALPREIMREVAAELRASVDATAWARPTHAEAVRKALEWTGHCSHPVGMAVHDVGSYFEKPLQPGLVLSLDPSLWVPEERLYIRVEDTGVVTEGGFESFTGLAPLDLDEVEDLVGRSV
ncbi:MAG: Xaa-Pro peptidase family protein [Armatimonadetes bacterium]|nr:Xaa-Pro peptidase family protein [Armatimonadota bacterium]